MEIPFYLARFWTFHSSVIGYSCLFWDVILCQWVSVFWHFDGTVFQQHVRKLWFSNTVSHPRSVHFLILLRCAHSNVLFYHELHKCIELCLSLLTHLQDAALTRLWCYISHNWLLFVLFPVSPTKDNDLWLWCHVAAGL